MAKEYAQAIHKVERLNSLNSLRDYFEKEIFDESDAENKINSYLNKYGVQSLFELGELFNQCFTQMKEQNLQNYNLNIERLGIWEHVSVEEFKHHGLKYTDTDITYIIRNNKATIEEAQDFTAPDFYIGIVCNVENVKICIAQNNNLLIVQTYKDKIEIKEKIAKNVFKEEYILVKAPFRNSIKHTSENIKDNALEL